MRFPSFPVLSFSCFLAIGNAYGFAAPSAALGGPSVLDPQVGVAANAMDQVRGETGTTIPPDAPGPQTSTTAASQSAASQSSTDFAAGPKQTKRILFIIPNFRSVSADEKLPPTTSRDKFKIFLEDSFDYSAFVEVGLLAGNSDAHKAEPEFHHGAAAYARYYWHSFADNADGNLMTEFLLPAVTREDPRYYTLGHGGLLRRSVYSVTRLLVTRGDQGKDTPNFSEIVGNGAASGLSNLYYPSPDRTWTKTGQRWVLEVGIDGVSNIVKEFWPDINAKIFHDKY